MCVMGGREGRGEGGRVGGMEGGREGVVPPVSLGGQQGWRAGSLMMTTRETQSGTEWRQGNRPLYYQCLLALI